MPDRKSPNDRSVEPESSIVPSGNIPNSNPSMPNKPLAKQALQETTSTFKEDAHARAVAIDIADVAGDIATFGGYDSIIKAGNKDSDEYKGKDDRKDEEKRKDEDDQTYSTVRTEHDALSATNQNIDSALEASTRSILQASSLSDVVMTGPLELTVPSVDGRYSMTTRSDDKIVTILDDDIGLNETDRKWQEAFAEFDDQSSSSPSTSIHYDVDNMKRYSNTTKIPDDSFMAIAKSSSSFATEHDINSMEQYSNTTKMPDDCFMAIAKSPSSFDIAHDATQSQSKTSIEYRSGAPNNWRLSSHFEDNFSLRPAYFAAASPAGQAEDTNSDTWSTTHFNDESLLSDDADTDIVGPFQLDLYLAAISKDAMTHSEKMTKDEWITPRSAGPRL